MQHLRHLASHIHPIPLQLGKRFPHSSHPTSCEMKKEKQEASMGHVSLKSSLHMHNHNILILKYALGFSDESRLAFAGCLQGKRPPSVPHEGMNLITTV